MLVKPHFAARILIVDDEADGAQALGLLLKYRGHAVEIVTDSAACLSSVSDFKPEAVLLDIAMPRLSGYELAKQIRARSEFDPIAIIAVSGYGGPEHRARSLECGCDLHFLKPVDVTTIEAAIVDAIRNRSHIERRDLGS
jgi:DNA-binding response OmpR family regulator